MAGELSEVVGELGPKTEDLDGTKDDLLATFEGWSQSPAAQSIKASGMRIALSPLRCMLQNCLTASTAVRDLKLVYLGFARRTSSIL